MTLPALPGAALKPRLWPAVPVVAPPTDPGAGNGPGAAETTSPLSDLLSLPGLLSSPETPAPEMPETPTPETLETPAPQPGAYVSPEDAASFSQNAQNLWRKIQRAYPDFVADLEIKQSPQGLQAWLKPLFGEAILFADQVSRRNEALWDAPSVADTLQNPQAAPYAKGEGGRNPGRGFSPGRARSAPLLKTLYGASPQEVKAACETVNFLGQQVVFNSRHGAAAALRRVAQRLAAHLADHPQDRVWVLPLAGTYAHRQVAGAEALSAHAFAVAIDLSTAQSPYWRWRPAPAVIQNARDHFPQAIVNAFEAEHFVWGGKWHAFDFMHFEYRPEIIE